MNPGAFVFRGKWQQKVRALPETGMGYTVVSLALRDGRRFDQAIIDSGWLSRIRGLPDIPFTEDDITDIQASHEKRAWSETP